MSKIIFNAKFLPDVELDNKVITLRRVVKVVKGGRRFSFAALVVSGDKSGRVGFGTGKSKEVAQAITKAIVNSKSKVIKVPLREGRTLHHDIEAKNGATKAVLRSAPPGKGIIAGGAARVVFEMLGVQDVVAKLVGSREPHNVVRATFRALTCISNPKKIADKRNKKISSIVRKRSIG